MWLAENAIQGSEVKLTNRVTTSYKDKVVERKRAGW